MCWRAYVVGCGCAAILGYAAAQPVEFPLGEYSFEEIAQRMSVGGRRVVCAPALRQRLAFVHLQPRSWQQTRALLEHALDVRFRPIGATRWVLERDPTVVQREQRLLTRLARRLDAQVRVQTRLLHACLDPDAHADRIAWQIVQHQYAHLSREAQQAQQARLRREIAHAQSMPLAAALTNWRAYERFRNAFARWRERNRVSEFLQKYPLASFGFSESERRWAAREAQQWRERWASELSYIALQTDDPREAHAHLLCYLGQVAQAWLPVWSLERILAQVRPPIRAAAVLRRGQIVQTQTFRLPPAVAAWLTEDTNGYEIPLFQAEETPLRLQVRASWRIDGGYVYTLEVDSPRLRWARAFVVPRAEVRLCWTPADAHNHFLSLDRAWAHAYQAAYTRHLQLLQDPTVQAPLSEVSQALMDALALWAKTHHQEVIAEVYERLQTLRVFGDSTRVNTLASVLNRLLEPCLLERSGSVWILRHWAAFVRRVPDRPLVALQRLARTPGTYADWRAFYRAVSAEQALWLLNSPFPEAVSQRLNVPLPMYARESRLLAYGWLTVAILERVPEVLRESLWEGRTAGVPLAILPVSERRELARVLQAWGVAAAQFDGDAPAPRIDAAFVARMWLARAEGWWSLTLHTPEPSQHAFGHPTCLQGSLLLTPFPCLLSPP